MTDSPATAAGIAAAVRSGVVRARDLVAEHLGRAEATQPVLNAFTLIEFDAATRRAVAIDAAVASGHDPGVLAGVPVAVKDNIDHAGRITTAGSSFLRDPAISTAPVISRLEAAGAIIIGRTGLHEFAFGFSSENDWFGPIRNPWDPATSPGGSSGGSGSAVAAGIVPIALGTDTGGSVRVPAALCGIYGFKPTYGRIPTDGVLPLAVTIDTIGPLARTARDLAAVYQVMAGLPAASVAPCDLPRLRIGLPSPWLDGPIAPPVREAFDAALAATGAEVIDVDLPAFDPPGAITASFGFEVAAVHRKWFAGGSDRYGPEVRRRVARALEVTGADYEDALSWRRSLRESAAAAFASVDFLATPTVAVGRKPIGEATLDVDGHRLHYQDPLSRFTGLVNHALLPAIALPLAVGGTPPPSLQLIGPAGSDAALLGVAAAMEASAITGFRPPPGPALAPA